MARFTFLLLVSSLLVSSALSRRFSRQTRMNDVSYLEKLTLSFRRKNRFRGHVVENLVDFMASQRGLMFLASHIETLWYQELLEMQYGRRSMCNNLQNAESRKNGLTEKERNFKNCLCRFYMPFLHCLAIGSQLLRENGFLNGEELNVNWSEETLSNEGKPAKPSSSDSDENSETSTTIKERSDCIPRFSQKEDDIIFGGSCIVPIGDLMTIELEQAVSTGYKELYFFDAPQCIVCSQIGGGDCFPLCKDSVLMVEQLVDNASARIESKICLDLKQVGDVLSKIFGVDGCFDQIDAELYFYQRLLKLGFHVGMSNWRVFAELKQKLEDGPECTCELNTFRCTEYCTLKKNQLIGTIGFQWDLFFGSHSYKREFNKPEECYSEHIHDPIDCPAVSSPLAVIS